MKIVLNGEERELGEPTTLAALLAQLQLEPNRVAVEVNRSIVPRNQHAQCVLCEGDQLEVVTLVGGG